MVLKLYKSDMSSPCRATILTAKAIGIKLEYIDIDLAKGETRTPEFLKLNPLHTVPTLDDDGKVIWDSHAINIYLISKYSKDNSLYPNDVYTRAVINQKLFFDSGILFPLIIRLWVHLHRESKTISNDILDDMNEAYGHLENSLNDHKWVVGDTVTLADFSLLSTIASFSCFIPVDESKYPNIVAWRKRADEIPYYTDITNKGVSDLKQFIQAML